MGSHRRKKARTAQPRTKIVRYLIGACRRICESDDPAEIFAELGADSEPMRLAYLARRQSGEVVAGFNSYRIGDRLGVDRRLVQEVLRQLALIGATRVERLGTSPIPTHQIGFERADGYLLLVEHVEDELIQLGPERPSKFADENLRRQLMKLAASLKVIDCISDHLDTPAAVEFLDHLVDEVLTQRIEGVRYRLGKLRQGSQLGKLNRKRLPKVAKTLKSLFLKVTAKKSVKPFLCRESRLYSTSTLVLFRRTLKKLEELSTVWPTSPTQKRSKSSELRRLQDQKKSRKTLEEAFLSPESGDRDQAAIDCLLRNVAASYGDAFIDHYQLDDAPRWLKTGARRLSGLADAAGLSPDNLCRAALCLWSHRKGRRIPWSSLASAEFAECLEQIARAEVELRDLRADSERSRFFTERFEPMCQGVFRDVLGLGWEAPREELQPFFEWALRRALDAAIEANLRYKYEHGSRTVNVLRGYLVSAMPELTRQLEKHGRLDLTYLFSIRAQQRWSRWYFQRYGRNLEPLPVEERLRLAQRFGSPDEVSALEEQAAEERRTQEEQRLQRERQDQEEARRWAEYAARKKRVIKTKSAQSADDSVSDLRGLDHDLHQARRRLGKAQQRAKQAERAAQHLGPEDASVLMTEQQEAQREVQDAERVVRTLEERRSVLTAEFCETADGVSKGVKRT